MEHTVHQSSRPPAVSVAVILLAVSLAIWMTMVVAGGVNWANPLSYVVLPVMAGAPALLIWLIFQGKNWARWFFLALFVMSLLPSLRFFRRLETTYSGLYVISFSLLLALELAAAVALCLPRTMQWFGGVRIRPNPQGGANGRQPSDSETNQPSAAAASRRSP